MQGRPGIDLGVALFALLEPTDRRRYEDDLLSEYYGRLTEGGVEDYSFDELLVDIRLGLLMRFELNAMVTLSLLPNSSDPDGMLEGLGGRSQVLVDWACGDVI